MPQSSLIEELKKGPASWNDWRRAHPSTRADLSGAYLPEADLRGYDLHAADLSDAILVGADLTRADLRGASFARADVRFAEFNGAQLEGAHFEKASGVSDRVLKASLPKSEIDRRRQYVALAVVVVLLAGFGYSSEISRALAPPPESPAQGQEGLDGYEFLTREIRKAEFGAWRIESVDIAGEFVTLRINRDEVDDDSYLLTLAAACGAVTQTPHAAVREIRILNRAGSSGWVYDNPGHCTALMRAPLASQRLAAAANSHAFSADGAAASH